MLFGQSESYNCPRPARLRQKRGGLLVWYLLVSGAQVMKRVWMLGVCVVLATFVGCEQGAKDLVQQAEKAADDAAADAQAKIEAAEAEAKATIEKTEADAKAAVEEAGKEAQATVERATEGSALPDLAGLNVGGLDLGKDVTSVIDGLKGTLEGVKNVDSAKEALPKLEEANLKLDGLLGALDQIPAAARPVVANLIKSGKTSIVAAVERVVGIEGVGDILKPVLDQIVDKLNKAEATAAEATTPAAEER
jgi:hypothetical protein